jgi:hypothetical protein
MSKSRTFLVQVNMIPKRSAFASIEDIIQVCRTSERHKHYWPRHVGAGAAVASQLYFVTGKPC